MPSVGGTGSPSGSRPIWAGLLRRNMKPMGRARKVTIQPRAIQDTLQLNSSTRYALKGMSIKPPKDVPDATRPSTNVRRFMNQRASSGPRVPMDAPLMAVDSTKLNRKTRNR